MIMFTVAVIGCGRIANQAHLPSLSKLENVRVKYACDIIYEKALAIKETFPKVEETIEDYNIALSDPEIDAVFVLTPNYLHYTITMDALRAGKHVFCEKPVTVNYELSLEMANEAEARGLMLNIGVCNRYNASVEELKRLNDEGKFGNIYHVYACFRGFRDIPGLGGAFTTKAESGGGVLIDWGIHFLDLVLYVLGAPKIETVTCEQYCEMAKDMSQYKYRSMWAEDTRDIENGTNDVDDFISGFVRTNKANISFNGAWAQNISKKEMYIDFMGDKGGARLNYGGLFEFVDGATLEATTPQIDIPRSYLCEDRAFFESIASGIKDKNNIENILESMRLLDSLYKSAEQHREIKL